MLVVVLVAVPVVQNKAWVSLVQQVVWDMVVAQDMVTIVVEDFKNFEEFVACFAVPLVATQN